MDHKLYYIQTLSQLAKKLRIGMQYYRLNNYWLRMLSEGGNYKEVSDFSPSFTDCLGAQAGRHEHTSRDLPKTKEQKHVKR